MELLVLELESARPGAGFGSGQGPMQTEQVHKKDPKVSWVAQRLDPDSASVTTLSKYPSPEGMSGRMKGPHRPHLPKVLPQGCSRFKLVSKL